MDDQERLAERKSFDRIVDLVESPVIGKFDVSHLREVHRRIFQDSPQHGPGEFRPAMPVDSPYYKSRMLESNGYRYNVAYAPSNDLDGALSKVLRELGGANGLKGLDHDQFSSRMAKLYGDLDHIHPFGEGNSRTLRVFTAQLAQEAGYSLDWGTSKADALSRDRLYVARDLAVTERVYPGLDMDRASSTPNKAEYDAYLGLVAKFKKSDSLETIIKESSQQLNLQAKLGARETPYTQGKNLAHNQKSSIVMQPKPALAVKPPVRRM